MSVIYLDNNATTRVAPEVVEEMMPYLSDLYGNPSSMHSFGHQVSKKVDEARERVADILGANDPYEIVFTSCGTESDNAGIRGVLESYPKKKHVITTKVEHPAVGSLCKFLKTRGYSVTELSVNSEGELDLDELQQAFRTDTAIVSVMYANNETGVIFPVEEIGQMCKDREISLHVDAVQAVGKIPLDMKHSTIDFLALSGHKLHAPKGIGALYIRRRTKFRPLIIGGHQERGRRGGTEATASIIALGKACELAQERLDDENSRVRMLRDKLESTILQNISHSRLNGHAKHRLPNTSNLSFEFVEGEAILLLLDEEGICASSGSACSSGSLEPSHVLRAMGIPYTYAHGSIRFSLSVYNTEEEIDKVSAVVPQVITRLREISPYWESAVAH